MRWAVQPGETPLFGSERGCAEFEQEVLRFDGPAAARASEHDDEVLYVLSGSGSIDVGGEQVAVFRLRSGRWYGLAAVCPHRGGPIADGQTDERVVMCPLHQNSFELATGCSTTGADPLRSYPVQIDGTEILMEWVTYDGETAPRLAQTRPDPELLASYYDQVRDFLALLVQDGIVHGDLSAYNILAAGPRLVVIDLPQIVDLVGNPNGMDFLLRDCTNICGWFKARGLEVDEQELFGELMAHAF